MTRKHFEFAVDIVRGYAYKDATQAALLAAAFARLFQAFNPAFDLRRFYRACGLPTS